MMRIRWIIQSRWYVHLMDPIKYSAINKFLEISVNILR